jgi:hypothetical protein
MIRDVRLDEGRLKEICCITVSLVESKRCVTFWQNIIFSMYGRADAHRNGHPWLIIMRLVKLVHNLSSSRHNLHCARTVRVAAQRHRMVLVRQIDILACDRRDGRILQLCCDMLLRFIERPCSAREVSATRSDLKSPSNKTHFFFRSMTNVPSLLYLTSP